MQPSIPRKQALRIRRVGVVVTTTLYLALVSACAHTPSPEERATAEGHYHVAVALVSEASSSGAKGQRTVQEAKYREALKELLQAIKLDPQNSDAQYLIGTVYLVGFARYAEAETHARKALELKESKGEEFPEADQLLGSILLAADRPAEALPYFEKARTNLLYRTPHLAEQELGWALHKLGRDDEAAVHLNRAIVAEPDLCGAYVKLADVEETRNQFARSEDVLSRFVARCDVDPLRQHIGTQLLSYAYYRLGMARLKSGDKEQAAAALEVCSSRFPDQPSASECEKSLKLVQ